MDTETKKILNDVATLFGVKQEIISDVWEYTIFAWVLNMMDNPSRMKHVQIPFVGRIHLRDDGKKLDENDGKVKDEITAFAFLNDHFKEMIARTIHGDTTGLVDYIKRKHLDKVIDDAESQ